MVTQKLPFVFYGGVTSVSFPSIGLTRSTIPGFGFGPLGPAI
jgi:hypothetical protein